MPDTSTASSSGGSQGDSAAGGGRKDVAIVGDPTSHGGVVITGSPTHKVNGMPVARKGDMVECPQYDPDGRPHGRNPIIEGSGSMLIDGLPVALHGHHTECGCELLAPGTGPAPNASRNKPANETEQEKKSHLFGTDRPDLDKLSQEPGVRKDMDNAWNQTLQDGKEHGGWIVRSDETGDLYTVPFTTGSNNSINVGDHPYNAIAFYHTHPGASTGVGTYMLPPSPADHSVAASENLSGIVRTSGGNYFYGPQNAPEVYPGQKIDGMDKATYTFDNQHLGDRQQVDDAAHERMKTDQQNSRPKVADDPSSPDSTQSELMGYNGF
jgi:uncharacterized Zn-binding protein involved in type VI secretion